MKQIIVAISFLILGNTLYSQNTIAEQIAERIAQRIKDTLGLTEQQKAQIFDINMQLYFKKNLVRQKYPSSDSLF